MKPASHHNRDIRVPPYSMIPFPKTVNFIARFYHLGGEKHNTELLRMLCFFNHLTYVVTTFLKNTETSMKYTNNFSKSGKYGAITRI